LRNNDFYEQFKFQNRKMEVKPKKIKLKRWKTI
jgi:hypothetical protein